MNEATTALWDKLLDWTDYWFDPDKADWHEFTGSDREAFLDIAVAWKGSEAKLAILEAAADEYGRDAVKALLARICEREVSAWWTGVADREGHSLDDLIRALWNPLPDLGFRFSIDRGADGARMACTACPHAELAGMLEAEGFEHAREWLYAIVCAGDPHIVRAVNSSIEFVRTKTLMQGDDCCNHTYLVAAI